MTNPFGQPGTAGSVRLAGTIAEAGPPAARTGPWELLDLVIDSAGVQWLCTAQDTWVQISVTKAYVDSGVFLPLTGGTITGDLTITG